MGVGRTLPSRYRSLIRSMSSGIEKIDARYSSSCVFAKYPNSQKRYRIRGATLSSEGTGFVVGVAGSPRYVLVME
jgi:hypothetical protein